MYPHRLPWVAPHTQQLQCWPNVGTTIPDLDTLELVILMLLMWYKVVLQPYTNPPTTICLCNVFFLNSGLVDLTL